MQAWTEAPTEPHRHDVCFYADDAALVAGVCPFLGDGLLDGDAAIVIATPEHAAALGQGLAGYGVDVEAARGAGRLVFLDAAATLDAVLAGGEPDAGRFTRVVGAAVARAAALHGRVRAFGEMVGLLWADGRVSAAVTLEDLWNDLIPQYGLALSCAYPSTVLDHDADLAALARVCRQHSSVLTPPTNGSERDAGAGGVDEVVRVFPPHAASAGAARRLLTATFSSWGAGHVADDAAVIVSELATNAVLHASSPFRLTLRRRPGAVELEVEDTDPALPARRQPEPEALSGRGLAIVDALSAQWGSERRPGGKRVWATIPTA